MFDGKAHCDRVFCDHGNTVSGDTSCKEPYLPNTDHMMKPFLTTIAAVAAILFSSVSAHAGAVSVGETEPEVLFVKVHADWCGACKNLEPRINKLKTSFKDDAVLFVTLDFTNKATTQQANLMAAALGIQANVRVNNSTGLVLMLDAQSRKVLQIYTLRDDVSAMSEGISKALADA